MSEIKIIEKPDNVSYQTIREILQQAHKANFDAGIMMAVPNLSADGLREHVGENGKTFIAVDGEKIVGTLSFRVVHINKWYWKSDLAEETMVGIIPEYQGKHIYPMLEKVSHDFIRKMGYRGIRFDTAETNKKKLRLAEIDGYRYIDFKAPKTNHYNVVMLRWLDGCPYSLFQTNFYFKLKKLLIKARYKPGRIKRFGI